MRKVIYCCCFVITFCIAGGILLLGRWKKGSRVWPGDVLMQPALNQHFSSLGHKRGFDFEWKLFRFSGDWRVLREIIDMEEMPEIPMATIRMVKELGNSDINNASYKAFSLETNACVITFVYPLESNQPIYCLLER